MSTEQAKAFIEKMKSNERFRAKILAIASLHERMKQINAEGFVCTAEEIGMLATELSAEQLDIIAGGGQDSVNISFN